MSNVRHWLGRNGYDADDVHAASAILEAAKQSDRALSDEECQAIALAAGARSSMGVADVAH
jgi:hypothetical protein